VLLLLACRSPAPDIVLISLDTTRADALSSYGCPVTTTPNLDGLAARGTRFEWALAHAPTTLSSHASVFTGSDPHRHLVVRNGWRLPTEPPTVAERFRAAGYRTVGVVGASALSAGTGIDRGFEVWDESFPVERANRHEAVAADVTDRALGAVSSRDPKKPLFLFVHYFDAHGPYDAPAPYTRIFGDPGYSGSVDGSPEGMRTLSEAMRSGAAAAADLAEVVARYRGEVAYVDSQIGRLLEAMPNATVVVFGDHGEILGEVPERPFGHGADVDLEAIHVPLIVAGDGVPRAVIPWALGLQEVAALTLARAGLAPVGSSHDPLGHQWVGRPVFSEATQPVAWTRSPGWPNLDLERSVVRDGVQWVVTPRVDGSGGLRRLGGAPLEDADLATALAAELGAWDRAAGAPRTSAVPSQIEAIEALGFAE